MSSKVSNTALLVVLVVLLGAIAGVKLIDSKKGERNFRSELVEDLDTSKITSILIYPKSTGKEVKLFKESDQWKVKVTETKSQVVAKERISGLFTQLLGLTPKRLAGKTEARWKDFEVDSSGSHVIVKAGDKKVLDIILGKFSYQQTAQSMETYVRLSGEIETYTVDGFLDATFNQDVNSWRDKTIIRGNKDEWNNLSFTLPEAGSFQLELKDSVWVVDAEIADANEVENYLNSISNLMGTTFMDDFDAASLGTPDYILVIQNNQGDKITVEGFAKGDKELIRSSLNDGSIFDAKAGNLFEKIFTGKLKFFPGQDEQLTAS